MSLKYAEDVCNETHCILRTNNAIINAHHTVKYLPNISVS